ncbi:MAG: hypothetical protein AAGG75_26910 [Bacteroidota bacterium]
MISHPSKNTNKLEQELTFSKTEAFAKWLDCSDNDLKDLFYGELLPGIRAFKFTLNSKKLTEMINSLQNAPFYIRVYMGANPNAVFGTSGEQPAFKPFTQAYNSGNLPPDMEQNSYFFEYVPVELSEIHGNVQQIPRDTAMLLVQNWLDVDDDKIKYTLNSPEGRLRFYSFGIEDTSSIKRVFEHIKPGDAVLNLYLGCYPPDSNGDQIFTFRTILQITNGTGISPNEDAWFEFSNPCPPLC